MVLIGTYTSFIAMEQQYHLHPANLAQVTHKSQSNNFIITTHTQIAEGKREDRREGNESGQSHRCQEQSEFNLLNS